MVESTAGGRHLELKRDCDVWALMPQSSETSKRLENNIGNKVIVWGKIYSGSGAYARRTISVINVFGPGDPMPMTLVVVPDYSCPKPMPQPAPSPLIELRNSDMAARGTVVWENGTPYLDTPSGKIFLTIPAPSAASSASPQASDALRAQVLDVVAAGSWSLGRGMTLAARTVQAWPVSVLISIGCYGRAPEQLQPGEAAARGTLVWDGNRQYLKTQSGAIYLTLAVAQDTNVRPAIADDAVVVGTWALWSGELLMTVRRVGYMSDPCPPP